STPIDYKKLDTIIKGDLKLSVDVNLISKDRSEIKATVDASKLLISTKAIEKKKGDALKITVLAESDLKNKIVIKDITLVLIDELLKINGAVDNFSSDKPEVDLTAKPSNKFDVSALAKVMKSLKDYKMSGKLDGSISIKGNLPKEGTSNSLGVIGNIDATNTEIQSGSFSKTNKMPLKVMINVDTDLKSMDINQFQVFLHTAEDKDLLALAVKGAIKNFSDEKPIYDLNVEKLNVNLSYFGKQIPALAKYPVAGSLSSRAKITGSMSPLPIIDLQAEYKDDVNKNNVNLKVSNTEKSRNLVVADISSSYINLTPYLPPVEKSTKAKASKGSAAASASGVSAPTSKSDEDMVVLKKETIESVKKALDKYSIKLNAKVDKLISRELTINNFILNGSFNKDEIAINKMNLSLLKGDMAGNLKVGLNVSNPTYAGKLDLKGIKVKDAADIFMPGIKGVIDGVVSFGVDLNTSGYSMKPIKKNMVAKGNFAFNNFVYSGQELNSLINDKLKDKLGALGYSGDKKILGTNPGWETVQGTFNIKDGKINIEQLLAKEKEYEATGKGELTFNEYMDMFIDVTVPYKNIPYEAIKVEGKD
ncbi:MAG: AsmA-like C-terminal region-containing protein, partial [bacterium]